MPQKETIVPLANRFNWRWVIKEWRMTPRFLAGAPQWVAPLAEIGKTGKQELCSATDQKALFQICLLDCPLHMRWASHKGRVWREEMRGGDWSLLEGGKNQRSDRGKRSTSFTLYSSSHQYTLNAMQQDTKTLYFRNSCLAGGGWVVLTQHVFYSSFSIKGCHINPDSKSSTHLINYICAESQFDHKNVMLKIV